MAPARPAQGWDRFATSVVTLGILFDWIPAYVGLDPVKYSLMKTVVTPVLIVDFLIRPADYLIARETWFGRLFFLAFFIGVGGGLLVGTVSLDRFIALAPVSAVLVFFLKRRTAEDTGRILRLAVMGGAAVAAASVLGAAGILTPSYSQDLALGTRSLTGVSWSTIGLYGAIVASALGGIVFGREDARHRFRLVLMATALLALGMVGMLVTGQRSAAAAFALAVVVSLVLYLYRSGTRGAAVALGFGLVLVALGWQFQDSLADVSATTLGRVEAIGKNPDAAGAELRKTFYVVLFRDLGAHPALVAPGTAAFIATTSTIPHSIVVEAYYDGGLVLMFTVIGAFLAAGWKAMRRCWRDPRSPAQYGMQFALWLSFLGVLLLHPGLETRLAYLLLGLCLAPEAPRAEPASARSPIAPPVPRTRALTRPRASGGGQRLGGRLIGA